MPNWKFRHALLPSQFLVSANELEGVLKQNHCKNRVKLISMFMYSRSKTRGRKDQPIRLVPHKIGTKWTPLGERWVPVWLWHWTYTAFPLSPTRRVTQGIAVDFTYQVHADYSGPGVHQRLTKIILNIFPYNSYLSYVSERSNWRMYDIAPPGPTSSAA